MKHAGKPRKCVNTHKSQQFVYQYLYPAFASCVLSTTKCSGRTSFLGRIQSVRPPPPLSASRHLGSSEVSHAWKPNAQRVSYQPVLSNRNQIKSAQLLFYLQCFSNYVDKTRYHEKNLFLFSRWIRHPTTFFYKKQITPKTYPWPRCNKNKIIALFCTLHKFGRSVDWSVSCLTDWGDLLEIIKAGCWESCRWCRMAITWILNIQFRNASVNQSVTMISARDVERFG